MAPTPPPLPFLTFSALLPHRAPPHGRRWSRWHAYPRLPPHSLPHVQRNCCTMARRTAGCWPEIPIPDLTTPPRPLPVLTFSAIASGCAFVCVGLHWRALPKRAGWWWGSGDPERTWWTRATIWVVEYFAFWLRSLLCLAFWIFGFKHEDSVVLVWFLIVSGLLFCVMTGASVSHLFFFVTRTTTKQMVVRRGRGVLGKA